MSANKIYMLAALARVQSRAIADATAAVDIDAQDLLSAGYDFNAWAINLTDEEIIQKTPNLIKRLDYIYTRTVNVQKAVVNTILEIHAMRETLEKLDTRKINREKEEGGEC